MKKVVNLPGFFWVKVISGAAPEPSEEVRNSSDCSPTRGEIDIMDPGRPPYLTEYGVSLLGSKVALEFYPIAPTAPFGSYRSAMAWRDGNLTWFDGAHSAHLIAVDA